MDKSKILIVTHEMDPYLAISSAAELVRALPKPAQGEDFDVRILMPRFGTINERRHRLHEVVRLSGINIVVDEEDYPLIIKVASLPGARLQVYFLDNEEFFKRKTNFETSDGLPFEDNEERMIFFAQGVLETIKKFGWPPNVMHVNGWFSALIPLYLKKVYNNEPVFANSKVFFSAYEKSNEIQLTDSFIKKAKLGNQLTDEDLEPYKQGNFEALINGAITYSDIASIKGDIEIDKNLSEEKIVLSGDEVTPQNIISQFKSLISEDE